MSKLIRNGQVLGGAIDQAQAIKYDNSTSGLTATNIQAAIDELASAGAGGSPIISVTQAEYDALEDKSGWYVVTDDTSMTVSEDVAYDNTNSGLESDNIQDAIDEVYNKSVIQNLIPFPFYNEEGWSTAVTTNIYPDGSVMYSGTGIGTGAYRFVNKTEPLVLEAGTYTLSFKYTGTTTDTNFIVDIHNIDGNANLAAVKKGEKSTFTLTEETSVDVRFEVRRDIEYNNFRVYPMLEKGEVAHPYKQYQECFVTNEKFAELQSNFQDGVNQIITAVNTASGASEGDDNYLTGSNTPAEVSSVISGLGEKKIYIYNEGDECTALSGGWTVSGNASKSTDHIYSGYNGSSNKFYSNNLIDLTPYSMFYMEIESVNYADAGNVLMFGFMPTVGTYQTPYDVQTYGCWTRNSHYQSIYSNDTRQVIGMKLDKATFSGSFVMVSATCSCNVYRMWFE